MPMQIQAEEDINLIIASLLNLSILINNYRYATEQNHLQKLIAYRNYLIDKGAVMIDELLA